jgi:hypothetical protein
LLVARARVLVHWFAFSDFRFPMLLLTFLTHLTFAQHALARRSDANGADTAKQKATSETNSAKCYEQKNGL